jgi:KDO2-lipid IV(A) lauroyltransferase
MIFGEGQLKDLYRRGLWGSGRPALERLPAPWEHRAVRVLGRLAAMVAREKRDHVAENMARAFPSGVLPDGRALGQVAADAFASHFANQYLSFSFAKCDAESWPHYLAFHGLDRLEAARDRGQGLVIAHPHMGPAQLPLHVLGTLGWPMMQVGGGRVTEVELSDTGRWAAEQRSTLESRMPVIVHDGRSYLRPVLRHLGKAGVVMTALDGTGGGEEIGPRQICQILGQPMPLPIGPAWIAAHSGAALVPMCCIRNPGDGALYLAEVGDEIPIASTDREAIEAATLQLGEWLAQVLSAHPGDWLFWDGFRPGGLLP